MSQYDIFDQDTSIDVTSKINEHFNDAIIHNLPSGTAPMPVTNIDASFSSGVDVSVTWTDPSDANHTKTILVRKSSVFLPSAEQYPQSPDDGDVIMVSTMRNSHNGFATAIRDMGLILGVTYYYRFFTLNSSGLYDTTNVIGFSYTPTEKRIFDTLFAGSWTTGNTISLMENSDDFSLFILRSGLSPQGLVGTIERSGSTRYLNAVSGNVTMFQQPDPYTASLTSSTISASSTDGINWTLINAVETRHLLDGHGPRVQIPITRIDALRG